MVVAGAGRVDVLLRKLNLEGLSLVEEDKRGA